MMMEEPALFVPNLQLPHSECYPSPDDFTDFDTLSAQAFDMPIDAFSTDHFRMFEFKILKCARGRPHDWTHCPYAHPGEKARRRDPRKFHYSATPCPDFRRGTCPRADSCDFAHGVFESWLHPSRYRTQLCKDATNCRRHVCFFAHTPRQLRVLTRGSTYSSDGSPLPRPFDSSVSSPTSVLNFNAVSGLVTSMRNVQLDSPRTGSGFGSIVRPGFSSLPSTPTWPQSDKLTDRSFEEEAPTERVESGRDIRGKIYAKLSKEMSNTFGPSEAGLSAPDFGWVFELVK